MFPKTAALGTFCALALLSPAHAQQYQTPSSTNPTGGGIAAPNQLEGGGLSLPSQNAGGGITNSPYSSYQSAPAITGGGIDPVTQGSDR